MIRFFDFIALSLSVSWRLPTTPKRCMHSSKMTLQCSPQVWKERQREVRRVMQREAPTRLRGREREAKRKRNEHPCVRDSSE